MFPILNHCLLATISLSQFDFHHSFQWPITEHHYLSHIICHTNMKHVFHVCDLNTVLCFIVNFHTKKIRKILAQDGNFMTILNKTSPWKALATLFLTLDALKLPRLFFRGERFYGEPHYLMLPKNPFKRPLKTIFLRVYSLI